MVTTETINSPDLSSSANNWESAFIAQMMMRQVKSLCPYATDVFPDNELRRHIFHTWVLDAARIRWDQIEAGIIPPGYPEPAEIIDEATNWYIPEAIVKVRDRLRTAKIDLTTITNLPWVARRIVLLDVLKEFGNSETPAEILARLEKMGVEIDDDIFAAFVQKHNKWILDNSTPSPVEIDPVNVVTDWLTEKAVQVHDYALWINQPIKDTIPKVTINQRLGEMAEEVWWKVGGILRAVKEKARGVLENYSSRDEEHSGLRARLAQLLTGKESIPQPTFNMQHSAKEKDWPEKFSENAREAIEWLKKHIPELRLTQVRVLLGLAALNADKSNSHVATREEINMPVAGEVWHFQEEEWIGIPDDDSLALSEWLSKHATEKTDASLETPINHTITAQEKEERFKIAGVKIEDVRRKELERLERIEARRRLKIQQAGWVDPNRRGIIIVDAHKNSPANWSPAEIQQAMNEAGLFA